MSSQFDFDRDYDALVDLIQDMGFVDAAKYVRAETGMSLTEGGRFATARMRPGTKLAAAIAAREDAFARVESRHD